jgi:hypothetical protein
MGTTRRAQASSAQRLASVPPLPSTLGSEGADQPFWLEIVAAQASITPVPKSWSIAATGYTAGSAAPTG